MGVAAGSAGTAEFGVQFVDGDGVEQLLPAAECGGVRFERTRSVRSFPSSAGRRAWSGLWWSATLGGHVGYRSWLARDHAMALDFDPRVVSYSGQPFWLHFRDGGSVRRHVPDFFARQVDGSAVVLDCRSGGPAAGRDKGFRAASRACELAGWEYRLVGELDEPRASSLRWLAGYRHPRFFDELRAAALVSCCDEAGGSITLGVLLDRAGTDVAMPPVLFHLLWQQRLLVDLSAPLSETSRIRAADREPVR